MHLFTYGSLMCDDIMAKVAGCALRSVPVTLHGFKRRKVHGEEYPGIVVETSEEVPGVLYLDVTAEALSRLDSFEGEYYERQAVQVQGEGNTYSAMAYIIKPQYSHLLTAEPWSFEDFLKSGKERFVSNYVGFESI